MRKENAIYNKKYNFNKENIESFNFDAYEEVQNQLKDEFVKMDFLLEEKGKIGNPNNLGQVVMDVVWEQFLNQIAVVAGEDFIKENRGLTLDLRDDAHIQTTENFKNGKIATHNKTIDYQKRHNNWQSNFKKDKNGKIITHATRSGREEATLNSGVRAPFDKGRPRGSFEKNTAMDHTISTGEIIRDPAINAHMGLEEQVKFANSEINLKEMNSAQNSSKGDLPMSEWLDNPNSKGQKPKEIFDITPEQEKEYRQRDAETREALDKKIKEGEKIAIGTGKQSQKEEAFKAGKTAAKAILMQLLAELIKEIIAKLIKWFKMAEKTIGALLESLKEAIFSFFKKLKTHLVNAGESMFTAIARAIWGPIVGAIKKVWIMLKQGWKSLKKAINYIKDPTNKEKPIGTLLMEVGKIVVAGMTAVGAMLLGEVIEKNLLVIPIFQIEIPLLGKLASILGIFFSAVISGIIGAMVINRIEKQIEKNLKKENLNLLVDKGNDILNIQHKVQIICEEKIKHTKSMVAQNIHNRHIFATRETKDSIKKIRENCAISDKIRDTFDKLDTMFDKLENIKVNKEK